MRAQFDYRKVREARIYPYALPSHRHLLHVCPIWLLLTSDRVYTPITRPNNARTPIVAPPAMTTDALHPYLHLSDST